MCFGRAKANGKNVHPKPASSHSSSIEFTGENHPKNLQKPLATKGAFDIFPIPFHPEGKPSSRRSAASAPWG
jgi:hypothetical protein